MLACLPGAVFLLLLFVLRRVLPVGIHPWLGHSSARSRRSLEAWEVAQQIAAEHLQWAALLAFNTGLTCWLLEVPGDQGAWVATAVIGLLVPGAWALTERALAKRFADRG